jgi:glycosyltransferase involved in cell wall biosynthesis
MKNKILEALRAGCIVIGFAESFTGFDDLPEGAFIVSSYEEFTKVYKELLTLSITELNRLSLLNCEFIRANYSWDKLYVDYREILS